MGANSFVWIVIGGADGRHGHVDGIEDGDERCPIGCGTGVVV